MGLHKTSSGKPSITLREAQDEAICFGWIDGVAHSLDESSYTIRLTPRRRGSVWSAVNIKRAHALIGAGRMTQAGLAAFEKRDEKRAKRYSYEREKPEFDAAGEKIFRANRKAWAFFRAQPPGYQRLHTWWVMSAKTEPTRARRLAAERSRIDPMRSPYKQAAKEI